MQDLCAHLNGGDLSPFYIYIYIYIYIVKGGFIVIYI